MKIAQLANGFRSDERSISGEHDDLVVVRQRFARAHERVSGAALWILHYELDAGVLDRLADALGFVTDDCVDVGGGNDLLRGSDHVRQQRLASDLMQDFGKL